MMNFWRTFGWWLSSCRGKPELFDHVLNITRHGRTWMRPADDPDSQNDWRQMSPPVYRHKCTNKIFSPKNSIGGKWKVKYVLEVICSCLHCMQALCNDNYFWLIELCNLIKFQWISVCVIILSETFNDFSDSRLMSLNLDLTFPAKFRLPGCYASSQQANCRSDPLRQT